MSIYVGDKKAKLYHGDYCPVQLYKGDVKIAGYTDGEKVGAQISGINTYNDALFPTIEGKSEQTVAVQSANLCPSDWSKWTLSGGAFIDSEGYCVLPNMDSRASIQVRWDKAASYFQISLFADNQFVSSASYLDAAGLVIAGNGWANTGVVRQVQLFGARSPTTNQYAKAISECINVSFSLERSPRYAPNAYKFRDVCMQKRFDSVPDYIPFVPNSPSPDYPSPIRSSENFDVVSCGRNLFDKRIYNGIVTYTADGFTYTNKEMYRIHSTPIPIDFKPNTQYTMSCDAKDSASTRNCIINAIFTDGTYQYLSIINSDVLTHYSKTTFPNRTVKSLNISYAESAPPTVITINNFQIVEGTVDTPYEPYHAATTAHITDPLRSVGDVSDSIEVSEGKVEVVRRCAQYIADGKKGGFIQEYTSPECAGFSIGGIQGSRETTRALCSHISKFSSTILASQTTTEEASYLGGYPPSFENLYFKLRKSHFPGWQESWTDAQKSGAFKQWLIDQKMAGTPVITQYILCEPTRTDITATPLGQALLAMRTYPHYTQVYTNATLPPTLRAKIKEMVL